MITTDYILRIYLWKPIEIDYNDILKQERTSPIMLLKDPATASELDRVIFNNDNSIFHLTHLYNLIDIISSGKIYSREYVSENNIKFTNSAGAVVSRLSEPHKFARFYLRTRTPTQFFNQDLGLKSNGKYYNRYENLLFPKCPFTTIISCSIDEMISTSTNECFVSFNNLQKSLITIHEANIENITKAYQYNRESFNSVYGYKTYGTNKGQSEFVVKDFADLSKLNKFRITVREIQVKELLILELQKRDLLKNISHLKINNSKCNFSNGVYILELKNLPNTKIYLICEEETGIENNSYFVKEGSRNKLNLQLHSLNSIVLNTDFDRSFKWIINNKSNHSYICNGEIINKSEYKIMDTKELSRLT